MARKKPYFRIAWKKHEKHKNKRIKKHKNIKTRKHENTKHAMKHSGVKNPEM